RPDLESVDMPSGKILYRPGAKIDHVYFPGHAMISVVAYTANGRSVEVGVIGQEGAAGFDVLLGTDTALNEHVVQLPNGGWRIKKAAITKDVGMGATLQRGMLG